MSKNKICTAVWIAGYVVIHAAQKSLPIHPQTTPTPHTSTTSVTQPYLKTISEWASSHPVTILASLGATTAAAYVLYPSVQSWLSKKYPVSLPAPLPKSETPHKPLMPVARSMYTIPSIQHTAIRRTISSPGPETLQRLTTPHVQPLRAEEEYELIDSPSHELKKAIQSHYNQNPSADQVYLYYNAGRDVMHKILQDNAPQLTKEDIRHLLWFLYIYAVQKRSYRFFDEGTFLLEGTQPQINRVYEALLSPSLESYPRMSSHYTEYFTPPARPHWYDVAGWTNYAHELYNYLYSQRGMDISGLPPKDMGTILFAKLTDNRIYIKPEPHGTQKTSDILQHTRGYINSLARKNLPENVKLFIGQFVTMSSDDAENFQKERVPADIYKKATGFVERAEKALDGTESIEKRIYEIKAQMKSWGIQQIVPKIADYASDETLKKADPQLHAELGAFLNELMKLYQDWQKRKGNEIVLTIDELLKAPAINIH